MCQKPTSGYAERLNEALEQGPRPMSIRKLGRKMDEEYGDLRGATYGGVRQYVAGKVKSPRIELLRAMANVLEVRADWLAFGKGAMTETAERARRIKEEATGGESKLGDDWSVQHFLRVVQDEFSQGSNRIEEDSVTRMVVLEAWGRLVTRPLWPRWDVEPETEENEGNRALEIGRVLSRTHPFVWVPRSVPEDDRLHHAIGAIIGRALRAPFRWLPVTPDDLSETELRDHVIRTCQVLHGLAGVESDEPQHRMRASGGGEEGTGGS